MTKRLYIFIIFLAIITLSCENSPRDILSDNYSGRVYLEKPNHKDINFVPSDNDISEFENQLNSGLAKLLNESTDTLVQRNRTKIISDLKKYKRRYYGVVTIESQELMIVNFLHPDCLPSENKWRDSLWYPQLDNYTYFTISYYPDDKSLFNLGLINYSH